MEDNDKLDLIIRKLSSIEEEVKNNTEKISSVEKMVLRRTAELKGMDEAILDEVDRVHQILDSRTQKLENKIG